MKFQQVDYIRTVFSILKAVIDAEKREIEIFLKDGADIEKIVGNIIISFSSSANEIHHAGVGVLYLKKTKNSIIIKMPEKFDLSQKHIEFSKIAKKVIGKKIPMVTKAWH